MELPDPKATLKVEKITVAAPGSGRVLLSEVDFELKAGEALGVIGPSGGGKTTLVRALTGVWPALRGSVRLDDVELTQWREDALGRNMGYLPQEVCPDGRNDRGEYFPLRSQAPAPATFSRQPTPPGSTK